MGRINKLVALQRAMHFSDISEFKKTVEGFIILEFNRYGENFKDQVRELIDNNTWDSSYLTNIGLPNNFQLLHVNIDKFDEKHLQFNIEQVLVCMFHDGTFDELMGHNIIQINDGKIIIFPGIVGSELSLCIEEDLEKDEKFVRKINKIAKSHFLEGVRLYRQLLTKKVLKDLGIPLT